MPYADERGTSTGDVAEYLEKKYQVQERFWHLHEDQFADDLAESVGGAVENILAGAPVGDPYAQALGDIEGQWSLFITHEDITVTGAPGVPTQAALDGVSHRLKGKKGARRPSFRDTGLYQASFRAWVE